MKGIAGILFCLAVVVMGAADSWAADVEVVQPITIEQSGAQVEVAAEAEAPAEATPAEPAMAQAEPVETVEYTEKTQMAAAPAEVWWGNRAVSFRNYIPIERVATAYVAPEPVDLRWDKIFFDLDKSFLRPDALPELEKVRLWMDMNPAGTVVVEGHTCDWASDNYNQALGKRRAESVKRWLVEHGIAPTRIETVSYGEDHPMVPNDGQRQLNRRAVVLVDSVN
ncbi:MAG: OmpA family protein [Candidatus Hydrogenedentes bacterium]|nr:OmpA family protein [Candidatus Hydrogenedentota bacterium]